MKSSKLPILVAFWVLCCAMLPYREVPVLKLNVLFFLVDDLGWMDLGFQGSSFYETPHLDALAKESMIFTRAYAACPVCSPTRASIMTGKNPVRTGITDWINHQKPNTWDRNTRLLPAKYTPQLALEEMTLAEMLQGAGYRTFFAGKWHLGGEGFYPENQGFQVNKGGYHAGNPGNFFAPFKNPKLSDKEDDHYLPERLSDETSQFISEQKGQPFFAFHSFYLVHTPLQGQEHLIKKYQEKRDRLGLKDDMLPIGPDVYHLEKERTVRSVQSHVKYAAMIEALDNAVGKIVNTLKKAGLYEQTIIIFTSDNGGLSTSEGKPTSNFPLRAGKGYMYEGGIRVPLLIRVPGLAAIGQKTDAVAWSADLYPSIAALCGVKKTTTQKLDGVSLMPILKNGNVKKQRTLFWHYPHYGNQGGGPASCIMRGDWKLIYWYDQAQYELFNIARDLGEKVNLASQEKERVLSMKKELDLWLQKNGAKFLQANPNFVSPTPN
jgi:arylsulfatase A-like enzyme